MKNMLIFSLLATFSLATYAVSFNCNMASNFVEDAICNDSLLSKLDDALAENYNAMLNSNIGTEGTYRLKATEKVWLERRNACKTNKCLVNMYRRRIDEICNYRVISGSHPICVNSGDIE